MNAKAIRRFFLTLFVALFIPAGASAQFADTLNISYGLPSIKPQSWNTGKKIGMSILYGTAYNTAFFLFDRFILEAEYAKVTPESLKRNFAFGNGWDNDSAGVNFVGHPAQGSIYHIINRLSGISFWGSLPISLLHSTIWEFFCESEPPSLNDFFTTSWNGMTLGEAFYRTGNYLFCKPARKGVDFNLRAGIGARGVTELAHSTVNPPLSPWAGAGASLTVDVNYGDKMCVHDNAPLNCFDLHITAALGTGQSPVSEFTLLGRLWGLELDPRKGEAIFGIYDHLSNFLSESWTAKRSPYRCSEAVSVGPGIIYSNNGFTTGAYLAATLIGAATTDYYSVYDRDYNFGSGYSLKSFNSFRPSESFAVSLDIRHYQLFTFWGDKSTDVPDLHYLNSTGDNGTTLTEVLNLKTVYSPFKHVDIDLSAFLVHRNTLYKIHPSAKATHLTLELGLRYRLYENK